MKENKSEQIHIRLTPNEKEKIKIIAQNHGYQNISKYIKDNLLYNIESDQEENTIHCITISSTLDYYINIDQIKINQSNKTESVSTLFDSGGRGINISKVLNEFNKKNKSVYISGGFSGDKIWSILNSQNIDQYKIANDKETRINVNIVSNHELTTFETRTSLLSEFSKQELINYVSKYINMNEIVIFSGSFLEEDKKFIIKLLNEIKSKSNNLYINSSTRDIFELVNFVQPKFLLLDNSNSYTNIKTKKQIKEYCKKFIDLGIEEVAFFIDSNATYFFSKEDLFLVQSTLNEHETIIGTSDAFLGGYISNLDKDINERLKWAAASQKAMSYHKMGINFQEIVDSYSDIKIEED